MEESDYDKVARRLAKEDGAGFLAWVLLRLTREYQPERWLDTRRLPSPGTPNRTCDTIAAWVHRAGGASPVATVVEFQTRPDSEFLYRLGLYCLHLRLDEPYQTERPVVRYRPHGAAVLLTGRMPTELADDIGDGSIHWTFSIIQAEAENAAGTLDRIESGELARCVLPWVALMEGADERAIVDRWRAVADREPEATRRAIYGSGALVFAELVERGTVWRVALEGWDVERSKYVVEWETRGKELGIAIGEERAATELRAKVARLAVKRFGTEAPDIDSRLAAADLPALMRWLDLLSETDSWPELLARLDG